MAKEFIVVIIAITLFLGAVFYYQNNTLDVAYRTAIQENEKQNPFANCSKDKNPVFDSHVTDLTKIERIIPPGSWARDEQSGSRIFKTHSFLHVRLSERAPIFAPADSALYSGVFYSENNKEQYLLFLRVSCEVFYVLDHIDEVEPYIRNKFSEEPRQSTESTVEFEKPVLIESGELIGHTEGTPEAHSWDFGVYNKSRPNFLDEVKDYDGYTPYPRDKIADCPYSYFNQELRSSYTSIFSDFSGGDNYSSAFCN
ncbi:MAG: hypothetical protein R3346_03080 [Candidatus Spechtbacterales bacterium]|nr:hypothetical protein [Candidatus Spechtbacterales bacterium]